MEQTLDASATSDRLNRQKEREWILRVMSAAIFLVFFQSYLIAPLIPALALEFHASETLIGLLIPAYLVPYGFSVLVYGPVSDRLGRKPLLIGLLGLTVLVTLGTMSARSAGQLLVWRILAGVATGGITPIALALFSELFAYAERGRAMGWIFGAIAGGMALGSTAGALLNPIIGWRWELALIALASAIVFAITWYHRAQLDSNSQRHVRTLREVLTGYLSLLSTGRGKRTYSYILVNGIFHGGIFAWLGVYFHQRYGLGDTGIGLALIGYGVPGMLLGPTIGKLADKAGRRRIIPSGFLVGAAAATLLAIQTPLWLAVLATPLLSLGLDMSHPLLAGIVSTLDPIRRGQAMAVNAFVLFIGFGAGSLLFRSAMIPPDGLMMALGIFAAAQALAALVGFSAFKDEHAQSGE